MDGATVREAARTIGGASAIVAGLMWGVKGTSILVSGRQPSLLLELAVPLFGVVLVALSVSAAGSGRRRLVGGLGLTAFLAGVVAVVTEVRGEVWGPALVGAMVSTLIGLVVFGSEGRSRGTVPAIRSRRPALAIGVATIPAILVGGLLSSIDERLLEVPLVALAVLWCWLGLAVLRGEDSRRLRSARGGSGRSGAP